MAEQLCMGCMNKFDEMIAYVHIVDIGWILRPQSHII